MKRLYLPLAIAVLLSSVAVQPAAAQPDPPPQGPPPQRPTPPPGPPPRRGEEDGPPPAGPGRGGPPPRRDAPEPLGALSAGQRGRWWVNPEMAQKLNLTAEQRKKMDDIFQQHRLTLVDLSAAVQRAELTLEPLLAAGQPDEPKIVAQIDRAAQARAELEKAHARTLLGIRRVLTLDQWKMLKAGAAEHRGGRGEGPPGIRPPQPPHDSPRQ
jgi:Spy/CpxP family protein refolding chaperone